MKAKRTQAAAPRRLSMKWKPWQAESFIRLMNHCPREDAIEILAIARTMVPRRGRIKWDWAADRPA